MTPQGSSAVVTRSAELYERALRALPGGISRNAVLRDPHPVYVASGSGCRVTDVEGVTRIDFANNMASLIHGHAFAPMVSSVCEQIARGTAFTMGTEVEVRFAEHLRERTPGFEKIRFVNSGTEAVMVAIKAARAFTGRPKIAKFEGAYHGIYDYAETSQAPGPDTWGPEDRPASVPLVSGTPSSVLSDVLVMPFNDTQRTLDLLEAHAESLSCVVMDLMPHRVGLRPANAEFVRAIREWTSRRGVLLVLDEVITYRSEFSGLQSMFGVTPDVTALGKIIGGGFPVGAVAGRADIMDVLNPRARSLLFPHSGTFSANPVTLTAGLVAMEHFDRAQVDRLNGLARRAMRGIEDAIVQTGAAASVTGAGSMFRIHMKPVAPINYRQAYANADEKRRLGVLLDHLFHAGFMLIGTGTATLSTPMGEDEIDALVGAVREGLGKTLSMG